ncbi:MAG: rhodanese-like domain-containing protein [Gammaproteobacteria bacterium]|nr:MAG: rhodanese-like domain-containing protein [Gammaproteobacteria bacterium]
MSDIITFLSHHPQLSLGVMIIFILLVIVELLRAKQGGFRITPAQVTQLINRQNAVVIDLRPKESFRTGHIVNAISLSANDIQDNPKKLDQYKTKLLVLVCQTGLESQKMAASLLKQGYTVYALAGGLRAWQEADMPLIKG